MSPEFQTFRPREHERELAAIVGELLELNDYDQKALDRVLRSHPKNGRGLFSKSEVIRGLRWLQAERGLAVDEDVFVRKLRMKPVRTASGVAPVTVLTRPHPCPGECVFCPSDVRMPKSYLSDEPGAQRAAQYRFDPYGQTLSRLLTYHHNGHPVDKAELIVLGGTWCSYPGDYRLWFVERCFAAFNDFSAVAARRGEETAERPATGPPRTTERVDGRALGATYNQIVTRLNGRGRQAEEGLPDWSRLTEAQRVNEGSRVRCVGLSVETRPDRLSVEDLVEFRRLGVTKVQLGYQSLSDRVLRMNRRGHDVAAIRRSMRLLRSAGFKIQAHWMPNLHGSSPAEDRRDYSSIFSDPDFRPDELKIYPCSLIESAELMAFYERGEWRPYSREELLGVLGHCLEATPEYCRLSRVVRDIPGTDIVAGNRQTNFREVVEQELRGHGRRMRDIRAREVGGEVIDASSLALRRLDYETSVGREVFLQVVTPEDRLAGFLRLSLPREPGPIREIAGSALIREVHVYGRLVGLGRREPGRSQHQGLGRRLIAEAASLARVAGYERLAVISAVGTRRYYRRLGFGEEDLYQQRRLA